MSSVRGISRRLAKAVVCDKHTNVGDDLIFMTVTEIGSA